MFQIIISQHSLFFVSNNSCACNVSALLSYAWLMQFTVQYCKLKKLATGGMFVVVLECDNFRYPILIWINMIKFSDGSTGKKSSHSFGTKTGTDSGHKWLCWHGVWKLGLKKLKLLYAMIILSKLISCIFAWDYKNRRNVLYTGWPYYPLKLHEVTTPSYTAFIIMQWLIMNQVHQDRKLQYHSNSPVPQVVYEALLIPALPVSIVQYTLTKVKWLTTIQGKTHFLFSVIQICIQHLWC